MIKVVKFSLFAIPSFFMGAIICLIPGIADVASVFYVALIGVFLGFDILTMIKETKTLPKGAYDKLKLWRYVTVVSFLFVLTGIAFYQYRVTGEMKITLGSFSASVFIIAGMILAGLDGNKIATDAK